MALDDEMQVEKILSVDDAEIASGTMVEEGHVLGDSDFLMVKRQAPDCYCL
jgi:hypothetical protein